MNMNRLVPIAGIKEDPIWPRSEDGRHRSNLSGHSGIAQFTNRYISLAAQVDQDVSIRIDARRLEWMHDDGGVGHLDDRGARHDVAGNEALAPEDRREIEVAQLRPVDRAGAGARVTRRRATGLRRGDDARLGAHRGGAHAIGHDLHARLAEPGALAVDRLVAAVGVADELRPRALLERPPRHPHPHLLDLAPFAGVGPACGPGP